MHNGREENDKSAKTACSPFAGARVLIVEDDPSINDVISSALAQDGYVCTCAYSGTEARMVVEAGVVRHRLVRFDASGAFGKN
ncbi:MAG: hypothetical protein ACLTQI_06040 [Slackia sp.]